jgi:hypothetical protein
MPTYVPAQVQFLLPCMQASLVPLRAMNTARFLESLLRLAVPNTIIWLCGFCECLFCRAGRARPVVTVHACCTVPSVVQP